jgi:hypothetical protein
VPVIVNELALTLITESVDFHRGIFLLKCLFTPFVIAALLLFCVRMYLNDLYISIPDRLLISVALAQVRSGVFQTTIHFFLFVSATPCASPSPWPSIFSEYSFLARHPV